MTINDVHTYETINNVHSYEDDSVYIVTITVTNNDSRSSSDTAATITVNNLSPVITSINGETEIEAGELVLYEAITFDLRSDR